ncbi:MAG: NAD-dependent epimerase/dehydratase family protein [Paludibacteraceae bacterium]|nr:NAD-dependent epimerase/dehydratase family protein [Paludibacteraceae bacterium]
MTEEKLYIIGGSGFVGKNMVRLLHEKYAIMVFDKYIDEEYFANYSNVTCYKMELDKEKISQNLPTPEYIINLASIVTAERDMSLFDAMIQSNLKVLLNLFERFKDDKALKLFIQFGSSEEYGEIESPFFESAREEPNSPYALVKQLTTNAAMMLYRNYGFPIMVVRPGNLFGLLQSKSKFIPYVIEQLKNNQPLNVTPCEQKRDFIYVDDFVEGIHQLMRVAHVAQGEIVNISSGSSIALKDIIEHCRKILNSTSEVNYGAIPYRANEVMDLRCSMDKFEIITGQGLYTDTLSRLQKMIEQ